MRQPKTFLLLSVIVSVLVLGVAYAAIQNVTLTINGNVTATPEQANFNVFFDQSYTNELLQDGCTATFASGSYPTTANLTISGLNSVGDYKEIAFKVDNNSADLYADVSAKVTSNSNSEFISVNLLNTSGGSTFSGDKIAPGDSAYFIVKVQMTHTPIEDITSQFTVQLIAQPSYNS